MMEDLAQMSCENCLLGTPKFEEGEVSEIRKQTPGWLIASYDGFRHLEREYRFNSFDMSLAFTNFMASLAERERHYPVLVTGKYGVKVSWWTPNVGGLHRNDFIMAAKTDVAYQEFITKEGIHLFWEEQVLISQKVILGIVQKKYPELAEFARQQLGSFDQLDQLFLLLYHIVAASNADTVRKLLSNRRSWPTI